MNRDAKNISSSLRGRIDTIKCRIRTAHSPFDGCSVTKRAISELRAEGIPIIHDVKMCRYYNPAYVDPKWGYGAQAQGKIGKVSLPPSYPHLTLPDNYLENTMVK